MNEIEEVNHAILKLWEDNKKELEKELEKVDQDLKIPMIYPPDIEKKELLFIGLNPSFALDSLKNTLINQYKIFDSENSLIDFFKWRGSDDVCSKRTELIKIEKIMRKEHGIFFEPLKTFAENINMDNNWEHIDLFFLRVTDQNKMKSIVYHKKALTDIGQKQFNLSKKLIKYIDPKIIVVANAFASDILLKEYKLGEELNEQGYYVLESGVPIFFSSMIQGGHLDKYSRKLLIWQIKRVLSRSK
jgi:hypothetical protein